ncbi:TetR/AcrR family transcriptional regulator [Dyella flava]|uniref:TetR/AcrR family transcriptional regulator n=1 Tax=Dyella flava TaxID=1920170 RepID=A0ABS2K213_9GAMM|nr:TetR/AcrR family transcriptional regulator [Dyella flava]MBM7125090.1 TetR/AcrR family transcriptional regulator [Dyella flava]GLQ51963.1 TetR family transcriptional regulator [Dyella flava]
MRYDTEQKQRTREKVLQVAAKAIRGDGPDRIGVAGVMAEAGLTHGGFYAHFKSKDELIAAAIGQMFLEASAKLDHETNGREPAAGLAAYIDFYLSKKHRDARDVGCPMAALSSDLPRLNEEARAEFAAGTQRLAQVIQGKLSELGHEHPEAEARSMMSELVGALSLARVETSPTRSNAILTDSRRLIKQRLALES